MSVIPVILTLHNEEDMASYRSKFDQRATVYQKHEEALRKEIEVVADNLAKQTAYNNQSLRMKIDPYHEVVSSLIYYIDTGYRIIPENTYQDIDYSSRLIKMYLAYLNGGNAFFQLMEQFPEISDEQYIDEIMWASEDYLTSTITLTIIGKDRGMVQAMVDIIRAGMQDVYGAASDVIIGHSLSEINDSMSTIIDASLAEEQQKNFEQVITLSNLLDTKMLELAQLMSAGKPQWEFTWRKIVVRFVKTTFIAGVLGLFAAMFLLVIYYITSDKILDIDKLQSLSVVNILGAIPRSAQKQRKASKKAPAAGKGGGNKRQPMDYSAALAVAAQSIYAAALAKGIKDGGVALTGSIGADALREFAEALNGAVADSRLRFMAAGDPLREAAAMGPITAAEFTVIVEKQGVSVCSDVVKETERIRIWGKPVLGAVLLDADAI